MAPAKVPNRAQHISEIVAGAPGAGDKNFRALEPTAVILAGDILRWLIPKVGKFPKNVRYGLGARLEGAHFDVLELLIQAQYRRGGDRIRSSCRKRISLSSENQRESANPHGGVGDIHDGVFGVVGVPG